MNVTDIQAALDAISDLPRGQVKIERLERLAADARATDDRALEGEVLLALIEAQEWGGERDRMPIAFGRLLRILDDFPDQLGELADMIHWQLKWMTYNLLSSPTVPLETTYRWLDELQSRYRQRGYSPRPILALRSCLAGDLGDHRAASAAMEASISAPRDEMADCDACERNDWGTWRADMGDDAGALEHWAPLIDGERSCAEEPHRALARALLPLVRTGRLDDARGAYLRGYPMVRRDANLRSSVGYHIEFCALTGNEARGLEILTEHASWLSGPHGDVSEQLGFLGGAVVLLRRLAALGHGDLPVGGRSLDELLAPLEREIADVCARYDARNGSTVFSERVAARLAREPLLDRLPLGASAVLPRPSSVSVPVTLPPAEPTLDELVAEAHRLSAIWHPHADRAWRRVAVAGEPLPDKVAAEVAYAEARALVAGDLAAAHEALLAVAGRFAALDDQAAALRARAGAALAGFHAGDPALAGELARTVSAEADDAYAAGKLTPDDYLTARRAVPAIAMGALAGRDDPPRAEVEAVIALLEAEHALALKHGVTLRAAAYEDMLARVRYQSGDQEGARAHLVAAATRYVEAGASWHAVDPLHMLAGVTLDEDPKEAEELANQAIEHGGALLAPDQTAQLSSLIVDAVSRQPGRELDLVGAALSAAARWQGISEADTLHNTFAAARAYHSLGRHAEAAALFEEVMPKVEVPYTPPVVAMTRAQFGECLRELGRHRDAAEQFVEAARLVQDDPENARMHAELAWSAALALEYAEETPQALAAYRRAAELWGDLGEVVPRVRCLRSAAWLIHWEDAPGDGGDPIDPRELPGPVAMRAVLAELESLAEQDASEEVMAELATTREQLEYMIPDGEDD
ncbi:hypothetical protein [Microtetraspora fusca]|uniref:hypothetical protein n=1 Tax=Microtetraspora fusca TaxID=1997 RepID=UPI00082DD20C|nr:hypothetical protein [Microtetraspora fusca]